MDLYCPRCGEPWENDCFHDEAAARAREADPDGIGTFDSSGEPYHVVVRDFQQRGCVALAASYGTRQCQPSSTGAADRAGIASAMYDLLGDDMDGAAAMLDDAEHLGLF